MSKPFARVVLVVTTAFFAVFFLWPILQIVKGGFVNADGRLTFAFLAELLTDPLYLGCLRNSFLLALAATALTLLIALPLAFFFDRFRYPGRELLASADPHSDDPAAVCRRHRPQADLRPVRRLQRAAHRPAPAAGRLDVRLVCGQPVLGRRARRGAEPLPDHLPERRGGAGQRRSGDGGGGGEPRLHGPPAVPAHHAAADQSGAVCRRHHRLHLDVHRTRRAAHLRLRPGDVACRFTTA